MTLPTQDYPEVYFKVLLEILIRNEVRERAAQPVQAPDRASRGANVSA